MWSKVRNISVDISAVMSSEHSDWVIIVVVVCFEFLTVIWLLYCLRKLTSVHSSRHSLTAQSSTQLKYPQKYFLPYSTFSTAFSKAQNSDLKCQSTGVIIPKSVVFLIVPLLSLTICAIKFFFKLHK